ncbi:MAG: Spy/CpxP family protein refolding chaperone [Armatimonadota bacterium]
MKISTLIVLALAVLFATAALAVNGTMKSCSLGQGACLDLTDAQKAQLAEVQKSFAGDVKPIHEKMAAKRAELAKVLAAEKPDAAKAHAIARGLGKLHGDMAEARVDKLLAVSKILTPEQRAACIDKMSDRCEGGSCRMDDSKCCAGCTCCQSGDCKCRAGEGMQAGPKDGMSCGTGGCMTR